MGTLIVPSLDEEPWPTLGPLVCQFLEERCVYGPGDLKGQPYRLDPEKRAHIYRAYEVYPQGHPRAGKRRFKRVALSLRKGTAKTELAAAIAFAELHPEGPVRCDGFDAHGRPVGRSVVDPYIPMVAYTEEQTEDLAYAALLVMVTEGTDVDLFDPGLERIKRKDGDGIAQAMASSPDARDGARTTHQHFDETHRFTLPRLVDSHETMLQNIPKRMAADAWSHETTTTYTPGEGSVAQATHEDAEQIAQGKVEDSTFYFFHRDAGPQHDILTPEGLRDAIREASGPAIAQWDDFDGQVEAIATLYHQAVRRGNGAYFERVWLNRRTQSSRQAFVPLRWEELARPDHILKPGANVTLGFDGSRWRDCTSLILTDVSAGWQKTAGRWQRPDEDDEYEVPRDEVEAVIDDVFDRYNVLRMYGDPAEGWAEMLASLASKYGPTRVLEFYTDSRNLRKTAYAMRKYGEAMKAGEITHDGDETFAQHIGHARKRDIRMQDDDGQPLWLIEKERRDSPFKIDDAMAGGLSWLARLDCIAAGLNNTTTGYVYSA